MPSRYADRPTAALQDRRAYLLNLPRLHHIEERGELYAIEQELKDRNVVFIGLLSIGLDFKPARTMNYSLEQVIHMPAGKEINVLIAENVLGHVWLHNNPYGFLRPKEDADELVAYGGSNYGKHPKHESGAWVDSDYKYSSAIDDAWVVVRAMKARRYWLYFQDNSGETESYRAEFVGNRQSEKGYAETAPLAICRAALLALLEVDRMAI